MKRSICRILTAVLLLTSTNLGVCSVAHAACLTPDGVYASINGVGTENGTLWWNSYQRYTYAITVTDVRNGRDGRFFVRVWKAGVGGYQTNDVFSIPDGTTSTFRRNNYYVPFQIAKIGFGIAQVGMQEYQIGWDYNQPCGQ
jgi:hypothetical protein